MSYRDELLKGYQEGNFLGAIYTCLSANHVGRDDLASAVAALHNEKLIDAVEAFDALNNHSSNGTNFFLTRDIFEQALPNIEAPVVPVMRCVLNLYRSAGQDLAAGTIVGKFVEYCSKQTVRSQEALAEAEANPVDFSDLLPAILSAGFRSDHHTFLTHAIRLSKHENFDLRRGAIFSLTNFDPQEDVALLEVAIAGLEHCAEKEADDSVLAASLRAAYALMQRNRNQEQRITALIASTLLKGGNYTIYAASEILFFHATEFSALLADKLLTSLARVEASHKGTLNNIDFGISRLLKAGDSEMAIQWLENMLLAYPKDLTMGTFDSVTGEILGNNVLLKKILTRWLMSGERSLCNAVHDIVTSSHRQENLLLEIDLDELKSVDMTHMFFLARKIIGYLFMQPVSAASLIVSLMRQTDDDAILAKLGTLLFDPLLLNFTGKARDYVAEQLKVESGQVKETLEKSVKAVDGYLEGLRSAGNLPALYPSTAQREAHRRQFSAQMAKSMEEAEEKSVFLKLVSKSVLLYGRKSINYVHDVGGQSHRMETPLHSHGVEIEFPRMEYLDPFGLDYMLRIFRNERIKA